MEALPAGFESRVVQRRGARRPLARDADGPRARGLSAHRGAGAGRHRGGVLRARHHPRRHHHRRRGLVHPAAVRRSRPADLVSCPTSTCSGRASRAMPPRRSAARVGSSSAATCCTPTWASPTCGSHRHAGDGLRAAARGEDVPEGLKRALAVGNRWQDLLTSSFKTGRTGNEVLAAIQDTARREGIDPQHLFAPDRLPRSRCRRDGRDVGQSRRHPDPRRLEGVSEHGFLDRREREGAGARVERPAR
jgi:hypothetical protein